MYMWYPGCTLFWSKKVVNKTSVGSVKLGKALDLGTDVVQAILEIFHPLVDRVKGGEGVPNFLDHLITVRKPCIPNLRPLGPFLHVEKFVVVVGGGGC